MAEFVDATEKQGWMRPAQSFLAVCEILRNV
jgi:hypothetical protein